MDVISERRHEGMWRVWVRGADGFFREAFQDCVTRAQVADAVRRARSQRQDVKVMNIAEFVMLSAAELEHIVTVH